MRKPGNVASGFAAPSTVALGLLVFLTWGCGADDSPAGTGTLPPVGQADQPKASSLSIDEAALKGTVTGGKLAVSIPLRNDGAGVAAGKLAVTIAQVDGAKTFATVAAPYDLVAGSTGTAEAELALPPGVSAQADWSAFNVVVEGAAQGLRVTRSLLALVGTYDVQLEGPKTVTPGRNASYRVIAEDPHSHAPLANVPVSLAVKAAGKTTIFTAMTSPKGDAVFNVPLSTPGDVIVEVSGALYGTTTVISDGATVEAPGSKILLTTDKPLYQPGQTIHLRALALDRVTGKPMAGQAVVFEISDGKGNKICRRSRQSDAYGLTATDFGLGQVLNMGTFQLRVTVGADKADKTVTVSRYALPKFKVDVAADKPWYTPGQTVNGTVDARYFFGKVAAGADVSLEAATLDIGQTVFARVMGKTDAQGRFPFQVVLPTVLVGLPIQSGAGLVNLTVKVTDTAGQQVTQQQPVTVAARPLRLALVPESTVLVPGLPNHLDLFVTDPLGGPTVGAAVQVAAGATTLFAGTTDGYGHASFDWTPPDGKTTGLMVTATTKDALGVTEPFMLGAQAGAQHLLVRTDKAVYGLGDVVSVDVAVSGQPSTVYLDWLTGGQDVDMQTLDVKNGAAHFTKTVDSGLVGGNRVEAFVVGADGNVVRAGRSIFVRDKGGLSVELATDAAQYTPGAPAKLTFSVKDETGAPAVAALGVQIVDQAVFALVDAQPGLLRTVFQLEADFAQPTYELRPPAVDVTKVLFDDTAATDAVAAGAAQVRAAALLASMRGGGVMGIQKSSAATLLTDVRAKLTPFFDAEKARLVPAVQAAAERAIAGLRAQSCEAASYYCTSRNMPYLAALQHDLAGMVSAYDFWGNVYTVTTPTTGELMRLTSRGPDERAASDDDTNLTFALADLKLSIDLTKTAGPTFAPGVGNANAGGGGPVATVPGAAQPPTVDTAAPGPTPPATTSSGAPAADMTPRVRQDFPETLYVNPELITGPDGKATISVDMADSITEWRVSSLAHSQAGKVGGGVGGVKVFQEFFVDIDFPATLTRGDTVEFPVAVYNYLSTPQTVHVALQPGSWYTATGATAADVPLAAGQVTGIRFPVRVDAVGRQTLTVKATGGARSDAVARSVLVEPDGLLVAKPQSGSLAAGATTLSTAFPAEAIAGSQKLYLNVFPAYLSQVVQGMDSLLRVPTGCFEQTTSTAWPNVLVTDYLKQTNQLKPEIQLKAESLMSAGYQRLLTFEHAGGGYSWFGENDPAPFLSVTAFGLMEFGDMAKVQTVDPAMVDRTTRWLVGQQAADGSWAGDRSEFFTFQTSLLRNTAFVVWALASSGDKGPELAKGLAFVKKALATEKPDAYTLGIIANAYLTAAPGDATGAAIVDQIVAAATIDGDKATAHWDTGGTQTNFYGAGSDGAVATTGLCTQALLLAGGHKTLVDQALAFLTSSRDSMGNFGSTQATIWTLRALLLAAKMGTEGAVGTFDVAVDGASFAQVALTKDQSDVMTTIDMGTLATTGAHAVALTFAGTGKVSYNLISQHNLPWTMMTPPPAGPLSIGIAYDKTSLAVDDTATATVTVRNNTQSQQDMILVTVGIPPGFQVATTDLDVYKAKKTLSSYELTGKQLILYVPSLKAATAQSFVYHLTATMPVKASDGGVMAILYYQPEKKVVSPATMIEALSPH
jgi:hypothetical protein